MAPQALQVAFQLQPASYWLGGNLDLSDALVPGFHWDYDPSTKARLFQLDNSTCISNDSVHYDCFSSCNSNAFDTFPKLATCSNIFLLWNTSYTYCDSDCVVLDPHNVPLQTPENQPGRYVTTPEVVSLGNSTYTFIKNCLRKKCQDTEGCKEQLSDDGLGPEWEASDDDLGPGWEASDDDLGPGWEATSISEIGDSLCTAIPGQLDPDLGGIGVYISYWIHSCLVLFLFIISLLFKGITTHLFDWCYAARWKAKVFVFARNRLSSLKAGLADFHKSQCFFTVALNVAAIKIFKRGGLEPQSLEQIYNNWLFVQVIAISGYLPITFTLLGLHIFHETSWYLFFLSCVSIALSMATIGVLGSDFKPTEKDLAKLLDVYNGGDLPECQFKQPWAYCYLDTYTSDLTYDMDTNALAWYILIFCSIVLVALILDVLRNNPPPFAASMWRRAKSAGKTLGNRTLIRRISSHLRSLWRVLRSCTHLRPKRRRDLASRTPFLAAILKPFSSFAHAVREARKNPSKLIRIFKIVICCLFIGLYGYYFSIYLKTLRVFATRQAYSDKWSFGQVVALLVWVPPICEYVFIEIVGPEKALKHRLYGHHVTKDQNSGKPPGQIDGIVEERSSSEHVPLKRASTEELVVFSKLAHAEEDVEMAGVKRLPDYPRPTLDLDSDTEYFGGRYGRLPQEQDQGI